MYFNLKNCTLTFKANFPLRTLYFLCGKFKSRHNFLQSLFFQSSTRNFETWVAWYVEAIDLKYGLRNVIRGHLWASEAFWISLAVLLTWNMRSTWNEALMDVTVCDHTLTNNNMKITGQVYLNIFPLYKWIIN